jgi:hypothetical protein
MFFLKAKCKLLPKENTMAKKNFWPAILVTLLVFGIAVVGCDNGSTSDGGDPALNGTWVSGDRELKLNNGNFELTKQVKGTYTASGGNITLTNTHAYMDGTGSLNLAAGWYTKTELKTAVKNSSIGASMSDTEIDEALNSMFAPQTTTYFINGDTLTIIMQNENSLGGTFTKKT